MVRTRQEAWGTVCWHPCPPTPSRVLQPNPPQGCSLGPAAPSGLPAAGPSEDPRGPVRGCGPGRAARFTGRGPLLPGGGACLSRAGRAGLRPAGAARRGPCCQQRLGCRTMLSAWRPALLHPAVCGRCGVIDGRHQVGLQLGGVAGERQGWDLPAQPPGLPEGSVTLGELLLSLGLVSSRKLREASPIPTLRVE